MVHITYVQAVVGGGGSEDDTNQVYIQATRATESTAPPVDQQVCIPSGRGGPTFPSRCRLSSPVTPVGCVKLRLVCECVVCGATGA